jgi:glucose/arabinose dehydrogenase
MPSLFYKSLLVVQFLALAPVRAQTSSAAACSSTIAPKYAAPSVAAGWEAKVIASGLTKPRGIIFDARDHLLVVQQGKGVSSLQLTDDGGSCVLAGKARDVIADETVSLSSVEAPQYELRAISLTLAS